MTNTILLRVPSRPCIASVPFRTEGGQRSCPMQSERYATPALIDNGNAIHPCRERALYNDTTLKSMMAATHEIVANEDGYLTVNGFVFPPCIVLERGESLETWALREDRDFVTTLQVRAVGFGAIALEMCGKWQSSARARLQQSSRC